MKSGLRIVLGAKGESLYMKNEIKILAIETSCDETAAAVIVGSRKLETRSSGEDGNPHLLPLGKGENQPVILSNVISSQADLHAKTGGVVPEVASRAHVEAIVPVVVEALLSAKQKEKPKPRPQSKKKNQNQDPKAKSFDSNFFDPLLVLETGTLGFSSSREAIRYLREEITHIAVTAGPGLIGALLIGFNAAKTLAYALNKPIIPINHVEGHIYSALSAENFSIINFQPACGTGRFPNNSQIPNTKFPILIFTASGGHTLLVLMHDHGKYEILGQTIDDAIGEAYDKVARLLGLGYPGGPAVSKLADGFRKTQSQDPKAKINPKTQKQQTTHYSLPTPIVFPRPIINDGTYNFSFSGLKTSVLNKVKVLEQTGELEQKKMEVCAAFEEAVADVISTKIARAAIEFEPKAIAFAGGVAANDYLREKIQEKTGQTILIPAKGLTGDNAAMIGLAAFYHVKRGISQKWNEISVDSNLQLA